DTSRQTKNLNKLLIRILLHLQVEFSIKRKHLFFDFKFKAKYLAFISCLLEKPDLSVKTALKSIFRKSQVRSISEKFGLNLNAQIVCLSPSQWLNCFLEMLEVVPEKFHPS
ncbi:rRNA adenine N-6-methyltransferase family protein, partial [Phocaeicola vulgatus]